MAVPSAAMALLALLSSSIRVLKNAALFKMADLLMIVPHTAFGHTITGSDVLRRVYPTKRSVVVLFSDYRLHNSKLSLLWENPRFLSLPLSYEVTPKISSFRLPCIQSHKDFVRGAIVMLIRALARPDVETIRMEDLYLAIKLPALDIDRSKLIINYVWTIGYFNLIKEVDAPPLRLPEPIRRSITERLDELDSAKATRKVKRCALYLRQKKEHAADYHNSRRCGSPFADYLEAVRFLNVSGYQVLVTGDVSIPSEVAREFRGMFVDARSSGVDQGLFDLYAGTECDIFVGDPGGGVWLPGLNRIPRLLINAFPFFFGLPNSWVNYKTLLDDRGRLIHYDRLFSEFAHDYDLVGYTLQNNSSAEILQAVETFLQDLEHPENPDPGREILDRVPDYIWAKHAGTRICRSWLRLFDEQMDRDPAVQIEVR
ncbi:MAG TPA: TIGR04372 family glycosyltransferase [Candidatus Binatia bacterium]